MKSGDIRLEASQRLIEMLSSVNHQISHALIDKIRNRDYGRISYLDFGNENDNISYIINNKFTELVRSCSDDSWKERVWSDKRTNLKVGKLIKMLFEDIFPVNQAKDKPTPKVKNDIESFVNMFKAEREKNINYNRFEVVKGGDICYWYDHQNYSRFANQDTPLGKSCMRYTESGKFLNMYSKNTDTFRMLILKDDLGKLRGRAILWYLDIPDGRVFMDRIYTVNDSDIEIFKNYAKECDWLYRADQRYGWFNKIVDPTTNEIHEFSEMLLQVKLKNVPERDYDHYPYLDTLSIYNKNSHILSNNGNLRTKNGHIILTDYQGRYHSEVDERVRVFSTVYNENILEEEAIYVDIDDTWVYRGDEVYVHNTGGKSAFKRSPKIVESNVLGTLKYFLIDECIKCEYMNTFIHNKSSRIAHLANGEEVIIHYKLIGVEFEEKDGGIFYSEEVKEKYLSDNAHRKNKKQKSYEDYYSDSYDSNYGSLRSNRGSNDVEDGGNFGDFQLDFSVVEVQRPTEIVDNSVYESTNGELQHPTERRTIRVNTNNRYGTFNSQPVIESNRYNEEVTIDPLPPSQVIESSRLSEMYNEYVRHNPIRYDGGYGIITSQQSDGPHIENICENTVSGVDTENTVSGVDTENTISDVDTENTLSNSDVILSVNRSTRSSIENYLDTMRPIRFRRW